MNRKIKLSFVDGENHQNGSHQMECQVGQGGRYTVKYVLDSRDKDKVKPREVYDCFIMKTLHENKHTRFKLILVSLFRPKKKAEEVPLKTKSMEKDLELVFDWGTNPQTKKAQMQSRSRSGMLCVVDHEWHSILQPGKKYKCSVNKKISKRVLLVEPEEEVEKEKSSKHLSEVAA
jgi:hypothetical protein